MKKLLYTIVAIIGFANLTMAQVPSYVPSDGLKGWWGFNGNANDLSGNGNNGTIYGATLTSDRFGTINKAYSFNSTNQNYININYNYQLTSLIGTISVWIKSSSSFGNEQRCIFGQPYGQPQLSVNGNYCNSSNNASLYFSNLNQSIDKGVCSNSSVIDGSWKLITVVYSSDSMNMFVNGVLVNSFINGTTLLANSCVANLNIGGFSTSQVCGFPATTSQFFNGLIDDIGIWNRALTQSEITALYIGCADTITSQPSNLSGIKGSNKTLSIAHSGTGNNYKWQSNSTALGWQNVPNAFQYAGATTNNLSINNLTVSNHNQLFRVITSKTGCADTSNIVKLTVSDVAADSLRVIQLENDLANKHDTLYVGSAITTDTLKISIHTGISSASPVINSLKVYPNPASTLLTIDLEKPGYYIAKLSSLTGQSIITPTSGTIDISSLANGVYILTIYDSNNKLISTNKVSIIK